MPADVPTMNATRWKRLLNQQEKSRLRKSVKVELLRKTNLSPSEIKQA